MQLTLYIYGRLKLKSTTQKPKILVASLKGMDHFTKALMAVLRSEFPVTDYEFMLRSIYTRDSEENKSYRCWTIPSIPKKVDRFDEIEAECIDRFWDELENNPELETIFLEQDDEEKKKWLDENEIKYLAPE